MIELYYWPTPNGQKISVMLEECGLEYEVKPVSQQGKIMPARLTGASAKQQRQIARSVRRARVMGLMP